MTVKEIAKLSGVSAGTVDRVLHSRGRVAPETTEKIEAIIKKHQFTPNPIARRLKRNRAYRFCALIPRHDLDSGYWEEVTKGIKSGASEIKAMGIETEIIEFDHYDPVTYKIAVKKTLEREPDGVVFAPIDPKIANSFINKLHAKQIPYVFFDSELPGAKPICTIGQDSFKGGYLAGKLLHLFIGKITGHVAVFYDPLSYHIGRRKDGFLHYAKEKNIKTIEINYTREEFEIFLEKQQDLQGIFVSYVDINKIAEVVEKKRKNGGFFIVGYDLVPENHKLLKEGKIDAIISQRPQEQSRQALLGLYRYLVLGNSIEPRIEMPLDIYIKENIQNGH